MNQITRTKSRNMNRSMIAPQRVKTEARQKQPEPSCLYANVFLLQSIYTGRTVFIEKYLETKFKNDTTVWQFKDRSLQFQQIKIKLHTWDTNGQVNSKNMVLSSIKMWASKKITNIGIIFYDITNKKSLVQANTFLKQWKDINPLTLPSVIIVASKIDLIQKYGRVISSLQGLQFAKKNKLLYLQSSSKFDVSHIFKTAIHLMMSQLGMSNKGVQYQVDKQIKNMQVKIESNSSIMKQKWKIIYLQPITVNLQALISIVSTVQFKQNIGRAVGIYKLIKQIEQKIKNMSTLEYCIKYYEQQQNNSEQLNGQVVIKNTNLQNLHSIKCNLDKQINRLDADVSILLKDSKLLNKINDQFMNSIHRLLQYIKNKYRQCNQYFSSMGQANPQIDSCNKKQQQEQEQTVIQSESKNEMKEEIIWVGKVIKKLESIVGFIMGYYKNMAILISQKQRIMKCNNKRQQKVEMDNIISYFIQNKFRMKKSINPMEDKPSIVDIFANENILEANLTETQYKIKEITKQCSDMVNHIKQQFIKTKTTIYENVIVQLQVLKHNKKMLQDRYGLKMGQFEKFLLAKMD